MRICKVTFPWDILHILQWNTKRIRKSRHSVCRLAGPRCEARLNIKRMVVFWFLVMSFVFFFRFVLLSHIKFTIYCFFLQVISYNPWQPLYIWILKDRHYYLYYCMHLHWQYDEQPSSSTIIVINSYNKYLK